MEVIQHERTKFFDNLAESWDAQEDYLPNQIRLGKFIEKLNIPKGSIILDIGTGTGIAMDPLQRAAGSAGKVVGIDLSGKMLRKAQRNHRNLILGDCHELPLPDDSVDVVFGFSVVPHIDDVELLIRQTSRVLKPGGSFYILHFMSREVINDFHRKAGTAVERDTLPCCRELDSLANENCLVKTAFEERSDLFFWAAKKVHKPLLMN